MFNIFYNASVTSFLSYSVKYKRIFIKLYTCTTIIYPYNWNHTAQIQRNHSGCSLILVNSLCKSVVQRGCCHPSKIPESTSFLGLYLPQCSVQTTWLYFQR